MARSGRLKDVKVLTTASNKRRSWVKVTAQYWRITPEGALVFRNNDPDGGYPHTVALFAAGHWLEVKAA